MEKFIVSARKYRPQTFDTVVGQEHITTTLKNAIRNQQLAHAFLFCGPRGVGKTTCARILAKTINCENLQPDGEACNECPSCLSFNTGSSMNIHELDAASNNSVDDIRSLVEQVRFAPTGARYKVYIIDEVHMLSAAAFNAFLKTLEEPPPYAIFILATTEKHKILPTILSRCQIFDFKRITLQDTVNHLKQIAEKEHFKAEDTALQLIAQKSEGCMRDSLSILDKIVSFTTGQVTYENTIEHLNILDEEYYFRLIECMHKQDLAGAMLLYDEINKKGFEGDMVLNGFSEFIRNLLICKDPRVVSLLEVVDSFKTRYAQTADQIEASYLVSALNILNESEINFKAARNKRLHVELALIKLCYLSQALQITATNGGVDKKKLTDTAKSVAFKSIKPIAAAQPQQPSNAPKPTAEPKLIIETAPQKQPAGAAPPPEYRPQIQPKAEVAAAQVMQPSPETITMAEEPSERMERSAGKKLASLEALRQKVTSTSGTKKENKPLNEEGLQQAWSLFIEELRKANNPARQGFIDSELLIKDANTFEVIVRHRINLQFIEMERSKTSEFLKKQLENRLLQFTVTLILSDEPVVESDVHLSAKQQYQKIVEQYPLVKELKDRLRLELDY